MNDIETQTEHHIAQAAYWLRKADRNLWRVAYHAWKVWTPYKHDGLKAIAEAAHKSPSSIENYIHAYELWIMFLQSFTTTSELRQMRHSLYISHWWSAWSLIIQSGRPSVELALVWLRQAAAHGWSVEEMLANARRDLGIEKPPPKVETVRNGLRNYAAWILAMVDNFDAWEVATAHAIDRHYGDVSQTPD